MKNYVKVLLASVLAFMIGVNSANAVTGSRKIDTSTCETVYTNYYFFIDANVTSFFNQSELSRITHNTVARYTNNSYQISNFDKYNVGYGQVTVNRNSTTSRDGITSMSLDDFYNYVKRSYGVPGGAFSSGTNNFIISHNWYSVNDDGTLSDRDGHTMLAFASVRSLIDATLDANVTFNRETEINPNGANPFIIDINRNYYGFLTGKPVTVGNHEWYLQPSLYYVQYCSKKSAPVRDKYTITYHPNGSNVTYMPGNEEAYYDECKYISLIEPKRAGYKFLGWGDRTDRINREFDPGSKYCGEYGSIDLYAIWEKDEVPVPEAGYYNIYYKPNTTDPVTGMPSDNTKIPDNTDTYIANNIPVRSGWSIVGWNTDSKRFNSLCYLGKRSRSY